MKQSIGLFHVSDEYIEYLRRFDGRVFCNKGRRPYVGAVFEIGMTLYYAPLTSPKEKHKRMSNTVDFMRINGGKQGALLLNNMIPVPEEALCRVEIAACADEKYRSLLETQASWLARNKRSIRERAARLYRVSTGKPEELGAYERGVRKRCCDFVLLEQKMKLFSDIGCAE